MATAYYIGNAQTTAQVVTLTITVVAVGGTVTATLNGKSITYTIITGDTTSTAASAWQALLSSTSSPAEMQELTFSVSANVVTVTASAPGTPFAGMTNGLTSSSGGGATVVQATTVPNSSPSDVNNAANWLRAGAPGLPQNGDDVVLANCSIPLLWNLDALVAIQFATYTRWQSHTAQVGLPANNPNGYYEYRPTYFQFVGPPAGTLPMVLGVPSPGGGPPLERYNVGAQRTALTVMASGSASDQYAVRFLGTDANNTVAVTSTSLAVAMIPGEASTLLTATVNTGGTLALGSGVTGPTTLLMNGGTGFINCTPTTITAGNGSASSLVSTGLTYPTVTVRDGSYLAWLSNSTITTLALIRGSTLDKSGDPRAMTVTNSSMDSDCQVNDPASAMTWTNATTVNGQVTSGLYLTGPGRTMKWT